MHYVHFLKSWIYNVGCQNGLLIVWNVFCITNQCLLILTGSQCREGRRCWDLHSYRTSVCTLEQCLEIDGRVRFVVVGEGTLRSPLSFLWYVVLHTRIWKRVPSFFKSILNIFYIRKWYRWSGILKELVLQYFEQIHLINVYIVSTKVHDYWTVIVT